MIEVGALRALRSVATRSGIFRSITTCGCGSRRFYRFDFVDEALVRYRTGHGNLSKKLRDRVDTAMSIMHRAETRDGAGEWCPRR